MSTTGDLKAAALELKARLRAELAEKTAAKAPSESAEYEDFDSQDWGRTESDDAVMAADESGEVTSESLTASDEALMAELRSDDLTTSDLASEDLLESEDLSWPDELTPGTSRTPKPTSESAHDEDEVEPEPLPPAQATAALRAELSNKSRDTTLMALAKKGVKNVKVLGMNTIEKIVEKAVGTAIERSAVNHSIAERDALEQDARKEFFKLLKKHKKVLAEHSQSEKQRDEMLGQIREMHEELARAEAALAHEQRTSGPNLSPAAVAQLEATFQGLLQGFMTDERRKLMVDDDPAALKGFSELEKKLGQAFDRLLDRVKSHAEELLERRIGKLNAALEETESALRHLAQSKGWDDGIASIYDSIQGLDLGEADYARKKELLAIIFVENLGIQDREITDEDRKIYADALESLGKPVERTAPAAAPSGFATPLPTPTTDVAF